MALGKTSTPNNRQGLSALSTLTHQQEFITSTNGILNSGATLSGSAIPASGLSTAAAVQIVDGSGNQITSFGGGTQYTDGGSPPAHPVGPTLIWDSAGTWEHVSTAEPLPVTVISGGGSNASVGSTGSTTPLSATLGGMNNSGGNLASLNSMGTSGDAQNGDKLLDVGIGIYNGTNWDRVRTANTAAGTTGTGLLGIGLLGYDGTDWQYAGIDGSHNLKVNVNAGTVGTTSAVINVGQQTVGTSAIQVSSTSTVPTNGILIGALSTNSASIFIGGSGVTTSTGAELQPGSSLPFTCNLNTLYIISAASTTDKIWWDVT